jgi:hypothetical protein
MNDEHTIETMVADLNRRLDNLGVASAPVTPESASSRGHYAQAKQEPPKHWPSGVRSISLEGTALIGVDNDGRLHWDGIPVEVARTFTLSWWQRLAAIFVSLSAVIAAGAACVSAYADLVKP